MAEAPEAGRILDSVTTLKPQLGEIIEPDFGLLDELRRLQVLTLRQIADVRSERTVYRRNDALIDLITTEEQCTKLLTALKRTGQQHVVNFITQNDDVGAAHGDVRPLDEAHMRRLSVNGVQLLDLIQADVAFVTELASVGCITWPQREHVKELEHSRDRNDKLLEFLTRRSVADFQKFIQVLAKDQSHLVPLLITEGAVVGMDAELDEDFGHDVSQTEDRIVSQWRELSPDERRQLQDGINELSRPFGLETELVVLRRANSIAMYFICMTLSAVMSLRDRWLGGQLRYIVQKLFDVLSDARVNVKRLSWPLTDFEGCLKFFGSEREEKHPGKAVELSAEMSQLSTTKVTDLPLEMLEALLMRAFLMLYSRDFESDDGRRTYLPGKSTSTERRAYMVLSSVCGFWWQTLAGWPQSPTGHWLKHQTKKLIKRSCHPFRSTPRMNYVYYVYEVDTEFDVQGVTQLHDVVYMVRGESSTILRFNATTHQRVEDINVKYLKYPLDIVACEQTSQVYVASWEKCIWRMSADGADVNRWLPKSPDDTFKPYTLSVTSTRLLVTTPSTHQLIQFDADGDELRRIQLPQYIEPNHAVESPTGTFIVSLYNRQVERYQVVEVNTGGEVQRQFSGSRLSPLRYTPHITTDSRGNIFVVDYDNRRIPLLNAQLSLRRVIIDEHQLNYKAPGHLCYREQSGQLLVTLEEHGVAVFDVLSG